MELQYYYEEEADQFSFYRIPKILFTEPEFKEITAEAKIVYGLMLDRMSLSRKNHWIDDQKRVFIYYTLEEIMENMGVSHAKGVRILKELDSVGLISRVKQGMGKPTIIYVRNFVSADFTKKEVRTSQKEKSGVHKKGSQDFTKKDCNNTDINNTDKSNTESFSLSVDTEKPEEQDGETEGYDLAEFEEQPEIEEVIRSNIDYDSYFAGRAEQEMVDNIVDILSDVIRSQKPVRVNGSSVAKEIFRSRVMKLDADCINYALYRMQENSNPVRNVRSYILTLMYNAPLEMKTYYQAHYNSSLSGSAG